MENIIDKVLVAYGFPAFVAAWLLWDKLKSKPESRKAVSDDLISKLDGISSQISGLSDRVTVVEVKLDERTGK